MSATAIIGLQIFTAGLFFLAGCVEMRLSHGKGEKLGDHNGYARGKGVGLAEGHRKGFIFGEDAGYKKGHTDDYEEGFSDAQPQRDGNGKFMRRANKCSMPV